MFPHQRGFMVFSDTVLILVWTPRTSSQVRQLFCHEGILKKTLSWNTKKKDETKMLVNTEWRESS